MPPRLTRRARHEAHAIAGREPGRRRARHIEEGLGCPADDLPAARAFPRVDAGLWTSQPNRAGRHASAWNGQARHLNGGINGAEIRKPREKPEHEHPVGYRTVAAHHLGRIELHGIGNGGEIGPIGPAVGHGNFDDRALRVRGHGGQRAR